MKHTCLSIAGFDSSGGAGLQADLKTFSAFGCYGMSVLTALPVQNTCGVKNCYPIPLSAIEEQLTVIFEDIVPDSIKIGMLFSADIIELVADFLKKHASDIPIVLDPVMVAKSGHPLLLPEAVTALKNKLIPLATLITPNLPEACSLVGEDTDLLRLAKKVLKLGSQSVLLKGGHSSGESSDDLYIDQDQQLIWLKSTRIHSKNTHGTGCTLSAAIAANLALGANILTACEIAKRYLFEALTAAKDCSVGKGHGPVNHFHHLSSTIKEIREEWLDEIIRNR